MPTDKQRAYYDAIKHLPQSTVDLIEANPKALATDAEKITACKKLYREMQDEGHGVADMRLPGLPDEARPEI